MVEHKRLDTRCAKASLAEVKKCSLWSGGATGYNPVIVHDALTSSKRCLSKRL